MPKLWAPLLHASRSAESPRIRGRCLAGPRQDADFPGQPRTQLLSLGFKVKSSLEVEPELFRRAKVSREPDSGVSTHGPGAVDDFVDASWRDADVEGYPVLRDA